MNWLDWKIIEVNEKECDIKYSNVKEKGRRPYLIIKTKISQGHFIACPFTTTEPRKDYVHWFQYSHNKKNCWIKLDHPILFDIKELSNKSKINITKKILRPTQIKLIKQIITNFYN